MRPRIGNTIPFVDGEHRGATHPNSVQGPDCLRPFLGDAPDETSGDAAGLRLDHPTRQEEAVTASACTAAARCISGFTLSRRRI